MRHLGEIIQRRRKALRWSLGTLSNRSGVDKATLSRLENKVQYSVYPDNMARLAQAFGITVEELEAEMGDAAAELPPDRWPSVEEIIERDRNLTPGQREALLMHYRSYLRR